MVDAAVFGTILDDSVMWGGCLRFFNFFSHAETQRRRERRKERYYYFLRLLRRVGVVGGGGS
jgi:hypothetical protein